ncbi:FEKKY domain-containing protein [Winogradskyella aurantia]|uniref:DUF4369 domain-containing protein n=1 Tax=Winogradskyella aurantia TaxID=1915063 RepID=A0A265US97_9FLAO|nr:hypothetical protein [Winogradskyella aurantia]OZV68174.1 hypothetical protein CA834_11045 [Winogradskyella aurantia]
MRKIILTLTLALFTATAFATEIVATVVFENLTDKELKSGTFTIIDLNKKIDISKAESFKITLPEKGKYQFSFVSDNFTCYTFYPARINKKKNTITVQLMEKTEFKSGGIYSFQINLETNLTDEQIEQRLADGTLNFIIHGIDNSIPKEYLEFKEKYGIGLVKENCVIDPLSFKKATENNQMIFDFLNKKYGIEWQTELKTKPFGIK